MARVAPRTVATAINNKWVAGGSFWDYGYGGTKESRFEAVMLAPETELANLPAFTGITAEGYAAPAGAPVSSFVAREFWD